MGQCCTKKWYVTKSQSIRAKEAQKHNQFLQPKAISLPHKMALKTFDTAFWRRTSVDSSLHEFAACFCQYKRIQKSQASQATETRGSVFKLYWWDWTPY